MTQLALPKIPILNFEGDPGMGKTSTILKIKEKLESLGYVVILARDKTLPTTNVEHDNIFLKGMLAFANAMKSTRKIVLLTERLFTDIFLKSVVHQRTERRLFQLYIQPFIDNILTVYLYERNIKNIDVNRTVFVKVKDKYIQQILEYFYSFEKRLKEKVEL